jgi:hypothetical protein
MRLPVCLIGLLVGCTGTNGDDGSYPIYAGNGGNAGGGTSGGSADAGVDGRIDFTIGRVCLADDLRFPEACASVGASGISVQRGTSVATTRDDGKFDLPPATAIGNWIVSRADLVTSVVPYSAGAPVLLPTIATTKWTALLTSNGITLGDGQGVLHVTSRRPSGLPKTGVGVSTDPAAALGTYYGGASATLWSTAVPGPGSPGVALVPGLLQGSINAVAGASPDGTRTLSLVPIQANAITFVRLDFLK